MALKWSTLKTDVHSAHFGVLFVLLLVVRNMLREGLDESSSFRLRRGLNEALKFRAQRFCARFTFACDSHSLILSCKRWFAKGVELIAGRPLQS